MLDAKGGNYYVGCFPDGNPLFAQLAKIIRAFHRHFFTEQFEYHQILQQALGGFVVLVIPKTLEHFSKNQISD